MGVTRTSLLAEIDFLESFMADLDLPITLSHNDFQLNNLIYNEKKGKLFYGILSAYPQEKFVYGYLRTNSPEDYF